MKAMVGVALAISLALVGCQRNEPATGGGGGGTTAQKQEQRSTEKKDMVVDLKKTHDDLRDATKNASEARTSVASKNWNDAKDNVDEVQDKLNTVAKEIHPKHQSELSEIRTLADKAEASIKMQASTAKQDLDKLIARMNKFDTGKIQAGGGKPTHKTEK